MSLGWMLAVAAHVTVTLGQPEIVFDYSAMTCQQAHGYDLPDIPARAVRTPDGGILLILSGPPYNYPMRGPTFGSLAHDCTAMLVTGDSPFANTFDNQEWLLSPYREGTTIHALIHNEFHDPIATNCSPGVSTPGNPCWYNAVTYAVSTDGGRTFQQPPSPSQLVAALPIPWDPNAGQNTPGRRNSPPAPYGYMSPSNIVRGADGAYYALFRSLPDPTGKVGGGTCLMRTATLNDPQSWRAWDGSGFALTMHAPYDAQGNPAPTGLPSCTYVSPDELVDSLTFNSYLGQYIVTGATARTINGKITCGAFFSLSPDLLHWSEPQLLLEGKLPFPPCNSADGSPNGSKLYPSLIDHNDTTLSFERSGKTVDLYYVVWNDGLDRDLWRVPVTFTIAGPLKHRAAGK
jgi:hypothetical protein